MDNEAQVERRIADAKAQGRRDEKLDHLITEVGEMRKDIKNLDCKKNTDKITVLWTEHTEKKEIKQHILKTAAAKVVNLGGWAIAGVLAFLK